MSIEVGAKLQGKVSGITNFGAFIDLGDKKTGLVHISEVSNGFVKDINDVLKVGDEVTVLVTSVGNDGKIGLSIRKAQEQPQEKREFAKKETRNRPAQKKSFSRGQSSANNKQDFDTLMSSFLKDSDDRLSSLKRNTEGKRGGRGGRRN
ncbi:S1 domain-containing RNA-binding protein [Enterococcus mediterraneensis]|uniref:S1 domain-containing RNA-binding protein n=1 Tax=Enterococcus mediterraneensis TaxID=2364791 RepID=UPI000F049D3A|nr:S1 domain-containing RNA-binding protein [Enterococcus mediterraneensis]